MRLEFLNLFNRKGNKWTHEPEANEDQCRKQQEDKKRGLVSECPPVMLLEASPAGPL